MYDVIAWDKANEESGDLGAYTVNSAETPEQAYDIAEKYAYLHSDCGVEVRDCYARELVYLFNV